MKRIGNSKEPTPKQMLAMASNLQEKFKVAALIETSTWAFYSGNSTLTYKIYLDIDNKPGMGFCTWPKALSFYRELMKGNEDTWREAKSV